MDPGKQPLFAACGGPFDADAALSAACGAAMQPVCSLGYAGPDGGVLTSMLLNPQSNCSNWATAVQNAAAVGGPQPGAPYLDAAMRAYCGGPGSLTDECACLAFPQLAAPWCAGASLTCPTLYSQSSLSCPALEFAQVDSTSEELDVIQFTACNPYYCWLAACYENPQYQLLTSDVLAYQASGNCAGVCGQFISSSSADIAPMPPGSFAPASVTADSSGIGSCGASVQPAMLVAEDVTWTWPANAVMEAPLFITNEGDYPAQVQLASASLAQCTVEPQNGLVLPRSSQQFVVVCDQASISAWYAASATYDPQKYPQGPASLTIAPQFKWTYLDLARDGATQTTDPMGITAVVMPPSGPIVVQTTTIPSWFWLAVFAIAILLVVQLALIAASKRSIKRMLSARGVAM